MNTKLNKSDIILLAIYYSVTLLIRVYDYCIKNNSLLEHLLDHPIYFLGSLTFVLLCFYWLIPKFIVKKKYIQFIFLTLLLMIVLGATTRIIGHWTETFELTKFSFKFILGSVSSIAEMSGMPLGLLLTKKYYEGQVQYSKIIKQQKENELKLLRSQIDPHFLFNNLNTLDALIDSNTEKAKEYINRLSLIYRYLIKTKDAEVMELSEEIELAENYMFLIKTRFGNDYDFKIENNTTIDDKYIPTGAIQTLLENVVKHNKPQNGNAIKTIILIENSRLKVTNTKSNVLAKNESFGTGLENLKARYQLLSDQDIVIINTNKAFDISIPIIKLIDEK